MNLYDILKQKTKKQAPNGTLPNNVEENWIGDLPPDQLKALGGNGPWEQLQVGDPVIISGKGINFEGATGEVAEVGREGKFLVVDLYNHGKHSFHSSDVSYNDYADSDEEEARMYDAGELRNEVDEGADDRKQNALWAQITAHEKAAKKSKDLKQQHHLKMANQLRGQLKTSDNEQGVAEAAKGILHRVRYQCDDPSGAGIASGHITLHAPDKAAAARYAASDLSKKGKKNVKVLAVTPQKQGVAEGDDIGYHQTSGTKAGHTVSSRKLSRNPQASNSDVTLQSGSMNNRGKSYNFPKGTLFTQLPGGIFAKHPSVPETHPGYGHLIKSSEDNINQIHAALTGEQGVTEMDGDGAGRSGGEHGKEHTGKVMKAKDARSMAKKAWDWATEPTHQAHDIIAKDRAKNIANIRKNREQGVAEGSRTPQDWEVKSAVWGLDKRGVYQEPQNIKSHFVRADRSSRAEEKAKREYEPGRQTWTIHPRGNKEQGVAEGLPRDQDGRYNPDGSKKKQWHQDPHWQQFAKEPGVVSQAKFADIVNRPKMQAALKRKGMDEGQLNEYLVKAGMPVKDVLALNLFQDFDPVEGAAAQFPEFAEEPMWQQVVRKYAPIANMLKKKLLAQKRPLTDAEAEAVEQTWYDGSDAYDDMEIEYLIDIYDQQIDTLEALLAGNLTDEEFGEARAANTAGVRAGLARRANAAPLSPEEQAAKDKAKADKWLEKERAKMAAKKGMSEASPETTLNLLKGLKTWQVVIMNNYYRGKYSDYSGRYYYVLASSPEEAKQVVLDNADAILQELLAMKSQNGKKILPRGTAVRIAPERINGVKDGTEAGRMSTAGFKKMHSPQGPMMVKLSGGAIVDVQGQEQPVGEASFDYTTKDLGNDYAGFPSNHSMKHKMLAKIKPEKQQLYKDKMNNTHDWDSLLALFKVAKARGDIIEQGVTEGESHELDSLYNQYDELDYDGNSESDREQMRFIQQKIRDLKAKQGVTEGVAETVTMDDAMKVLRHYGAGHFKTTSNELHFYKNGQPFSVDLTLGSDSIRTVSLSQLNHAARQLKGQGAKELDEVSRGDYHKKATMGKAMAQMSAGFARSPEEREKFNQIAGRRERGLERSKARTDKFWADKAAKDEAGRLEQLRTKYAGVDIDAEIAKLKPAIDSAYHEYQYGARNTYSQGRDDYNSLMGRVQELERAKKALASNPPLSELSNKLLGDYKKAAGISARDLDKAGKYKQADKRFHGIVQATKKELDNDTKKHQQDEITESRLASMKRAGYDIK